MTIYLDLDGTILDISQRYKNLFSDISGLSKTIGSEFWEYKKKGLSTKEILSNYGFSKNQQEIFQKDWFNLVENINFLKVDKVFPRVMQLLESISQTENLVVCTARQSRELVMQQLNDLEINKFFTAILVTEKVSTKVFLVDNHRKMETLNSQNVDWLVGDTLEDMDAGFKLGINTCAVLTGLTPLEKFIELKNQPTLIKNSLHSFLTSLYPDSARS
jgi:phosphoglycolate phosphatase-like HAD superfamily hydrolase